MSDERKPAGYSRWAIFSGMAAVLFAANCFCVYTTDHGNVARWVHRKFSNPSLVMGLLFANAAGMAPVSLVLSGLALRQLRRNPSLRGKWIARIAVVVGTLGTAGFVFFIVIAIWNP